MINVDEIIDMLENAKVAYLVTVDHTNFVNSAIIAEKKQHTPKNELPINIIIIALDKILDYELDNPDKPQILSAFIGIVNADNDEVNLN